MANKKNILNYIKSTKEPKVNPRTAKLQSALRGPKGDKGDKGDPGYTPIKGVDYFDGKDGKDGKTPVLDVDYFIIPGPRGYPGRDGVDGKDGVDGGGGIDWVAATTDGSNITISTGAETNTIWYGNFITTCDATAGGEVAIGETGGAAYVFDTLWISNDATNNVTLGIDYDGTDNIVYITASASFAQSTHDHPYILEANSTLFQSAGAYITSESTHAHPYMPSNESHIRELNASNGSYWGGTVNLVESGNITVSAVSNSIVFSVPEQSTHSHIVYQSIGDYLTTSAGWDSNYLTTYTVPPSGTLSMINANGVSWISSSNGSTTSISASVETAYIPTANSTRFAGLGTSSTSTGGTNIAFTLGTNGLSLNIPNYITTYVPGGGGGDWSVNTTDGTDIIISTGAATNTLYHPAYLTTAGTGGGAGDWSIETTDGSAINIITGAGTNTLQYGNFITTAAESDHTHDYQSTGAYLTTYTVPASGTLSLINSNGVSFISSSDGSTTSVSASVETAYIPLANSTNFPQFSTTVATTAGTDFKITVNSAGLNISYPKWITTADAPNRQMCEIIPGEYITKVVTVSNSKVSCRPIFSPFWLDGNGLAASTVRIFMSWVTNTTPPSMTYGAALYSLVNSTSAALYDSTTATINYANSTASAQYSGLRVWDITGMTKTLSEGRWILGLYFSGTASGAMNGILMGASAYPNMIGYISGNNATAATNNTLHFYPFQGFYSATTAAFPANLPRVDIYGGRAADAFDFYAQIKEI